MIDISDVIGGLSPKTRQRVHAASEIVIEKLPTPSISLNQDLKGGIGFGRQTLLWGNKSSGKSAFCLQMIGEAQKAGRSAAWIDAEQSYDPTWAARLGVDNEKLMVSEVKTISDMTEVGTELMKAGVDIIVVDSISSLLPTSWFSKDEELKELEGTKQIGSDARDMANAVRMLNYSNTHTALVLISQIRNQIHSYGASQKPTGGNAVSFFSSTAIRLTSSAREADQLTGDVHVGNKIFKQAIGRPVNWLIEFNKLGSPNHTGTYDFYYDGDFIGIDSVGELLDIAEKFGVVQKKGAWYTVDGVQAQGRIKALELLRQDLGLQEKILKELVA